MGVAYLEKEVHHERFLLLGPDSRVKRGGGAGVRNESRCSFSGPARTLLAFLRKG